MLPKSWEMNNLPRLPHPPIRRTVGCANPKNRSISADFACSPFASDTLPLRLPLRIRDTLCCHTTSLIPTKSSSLPAPLSSLPPKPKGSPPPQWKEEVPNLVHTQLTASSDRIVELPPLCSLLPRPMNPRVVFTSITMLLKAEEWKKAYLKLWPHLLEEERGITVRIPLFTESREFERE